MKEKSNKVNVLQKTHDCKNYTVTMDNMIVKGAQSLSLIQKRLVMAALSKLNPKIKILPDKAIRITAQEYADVFQLDQSNAYKELQTAVKGVLHQSVKREVKSLKGYVIEEYPWLSVAKYHKEEGWVSIEFNEKLKPYITGLFKQFTKYKLAQAGSLRSLYAWRFLEFFEMYSAGIGE